MEELVRKISSRNLSYSKGSERKEFTLSEKSSENSTFITIVANITSYNGDVATIKEEITLCKIPAPMFGCYFEDNGTIYRLVNGFISKDGFYIANKGRQTILKFNKRDNMSFSIAKDRNLDTLRIQRFADADKKVAKTLYSFLIALGCINNVDEFNSMFSDELHEVYFGSQEDMETGDELAKMYLKTLFNSDNKVDPKRELRFRVFDTFFSTGGKWDTKNIFFSFSRFIGCTLIECPDESINPGVITPVMARQLDLSENVTQAVIDIDGVREVFTPDRSEGFTEETLKKVIKLYCLVMRHPNKIGMCDENAIYNRRIYSMYDYMTDYIEFMAMEYMRNGKTSKTYNDDYKGFWNYIKNFCPKAKETISEPNAISLKSLKFMFSKDVFRKSEGFSDKDKLIHPTYLGWVSSSVSSDSEKIGLTGCFDAHCINNGCLSRPYIVHTDAEGSQDEEIILEPWQTFNKYVGYIDSQRNELIPTLNGEVLEGSIDCDLYVNSYDVFDILTGNIVGKNSNQAKRDVLGYKAIKQSMPCVGRDFRNPPSLKSSIDKMVCGKTVREVLDEISDREVNGHKIYTEESVITIGKIIYPKGPENKMTVNVEVDKMSYSYESLRYILATTQNTKLEFRVEPPSDGTGIYKLDDIILTYGEFCEVGEELNLLFGNFEGGTYEDAVALTTDFVDRMGFTIKAHFHEDLVLSKVPKKIANVATNLTKDDLIYLTERGLPKKGMFFCKGQRLAKVTLEEKAYISQSANKKVSKGSIKILYSSRCGYVDDILFLPNEKEPTKIRVILTEILKIKEGDKTGNGHGNKGVVMQVLDSSDLLCSDGTKVDMCINPLGTIGRMNIGQIKEMLATQICEVQGCSLSYKDIGVEHMTIEELVKHLEAAGNYAEKEIIYKGRLIKHKFFVSKLRVYRTEHISSSKLNFTERPRLNMNGVVDGGQRMSELCALAFSGYGADRVLEYMINYQGRSDANYRKLVTGLIDEEESIMYNDSDIVPYRINAFTSSVGVKFSNEGISFITEKDVHGLNEITHNSLDENILHNEDLHGKENVSAKEGYFLRCKVVKDFKVIMPQVLSFVSNIIPVSRIKIEGSEISDRKDKTVSLKFDKAGIGTQIIEGTAYFCPMYSRAGSEQRLASLKVIDSITKEKYPEFESVEWQTGYDQLVDTLSHFKMSTIIDFFKDNNNSRGLKKAQAIQRQYGEDFFSDICLSGIPIAPINIRPTYDVGKSSQDLDNHYRTIIQSSSPLDVWMKLKAITIQIKNKLTSHGGAKEDKKYGVGSQGEKETELRDNMFARNFSNSSRSVAGYSFDLGIGRISLPIEIAIGMCKDLLISRIKRYLATDDYSTLEIKKKCEINCGPGIDVDAEITKVANRTIQQMTSGVTCNEFMKDLIMRFLKEQYSASAVTMTREPILHRQNIFAYEAEFNDGDCIKVNPSVCSSYNLDFDGDQMGVQSILDRTIALEALDVMSPYNGVFDMNNNSTKFKPTQDILLGLYLMTKYSVDKDVKRIYLSEDQEGNGTFGGEVSLMLEDFEAGKINLGDTVCIVNYLHDASQKIVDTVGNILLYSLILQKDLFFNKTVLEGIREIAEGGLSTKNSKDSKLILLLMDNFDKANFYDRLERVNRGALWIYTISGITISPKVLSQVHTATREELKGETLHEDRKTTVMRELTREFNPNGKALFVDFNQVNLSAGVEEGIKASIERNEFFSDLINSGARGKLSDFVFMYGSIGKISYPYRDIVVRSNYNRGLGIMEKYFAAMPVRSSGINMQNHLGIDGGKLREMSVLSSRLAMSSSKDCGAAPVKVRIEYDAYINGKKIRDIRMVSIKQDTVVQGIVNSFVAPANNESDYEISGAMLQNIIDFYMLKEFNGEKLTFKMSSFYRNLLSTHNVGGFFSKLGETPIDKMEKELIRDVEVYMQYGCLAEDGICPHCYGNINKHLLKNNFVGNIGVNVAFEIGQTKVQSTLDSAKKTKKESSQEINVFDTFVSKNVEEMFKSYPSHLTSVRRTDSDTFTVEYFISERKTERVTMSGAEIDVGFKKKNYFIPHGLSNFQSANRDSDEALQEIYMEYLKVFSQGLDVRTAEAILSVNNRFMVLKSEQDTVEVESLEEQVEQQPYDDLSSDDRQTIGVMPISRDYSTGNFKRVWLTKPQVKETMDVLSSLCIDKAFDRLFGQASEKKSYGKYSVFSNKFSFEKMEPTLSDSNIVNMMDALFEEDELDRLDKQRGSSVQLKEPVKPAQDNIIKMLPKNLTSEFVRNVDDDDEDEEDIFIIRTGDSTTNEF